MKSEKNSISCSAEIFWGEIAPCDHVVQIYESDEAFMNSLEIFVSGGFDAGDAVVIIATAEHLKKLNEKLAISYDLTELHESQQYFSLNAEECLSQFMVNGWPDEKLFNIFVSSVLELARKNNRKVRAFGEMVALLWADGLSGATIQLEHLWNKFCQTEAFSLFCAYPRTGFTQDIVDSIREICQEHSKIIRKTDRNTGEITYNRINSQGTFG